MSKRSCRKPDFCGIYVGMDIAGQSALEGSDSNCHYCDAQDQVKNCEKPKPDGLLGAVNLTANLCRSFTSQQPSHDQHKESHPSKDKNVWLDCAPERMPKVEHGTTLADRTRCHASRYALSQFSKNGFRETTAKLPKTRLCGSLLVALPQPKSRTPVVRILYTKLQKARTSTADNSALSLAAWLLLALGRKINPDRAMPAVESTSQTQSTRKPPRRKAPSR